MIGSLAALNSPGRQAPLLPGIPTTPSSRTSSLSRSRSLPALQHQPLVSETTLTIAVGLIICILLFMAFRHDRVGAADGRAATVLGKRSWKDVDLTKSQTLELQLLKKEEEIDALKLKLRGVISSSRAAEANRASQEALIMSLQQRNEAERRERYTAMMTLAERSKTVDECAQHQHQLTEELAACRESLSAGAKPRAML